MIKTILRQVIVKILRAEAIMILRRYRPKIVAVTGSVGKTGTKDAIALTLNSAVNVRKSPKSFNSEIGVPLTIIGVDNAWSNPLAWLKNILQGLRIIIFKISYPEWLVLEVGADRVNDIRSLGRWLKPDIAILTALPAVPAHVEFFPSIEDLFLEKASLLQAVKMGGTVIINEDDPRIRETVEKLINKHELDGKKIIRLGRDGGADLQLENEHLATSDDGQPNGIICKIKYNGNTIPLRLTKLYGFHQLYAVLAAIAVSIVAEKPLLTSIAAVETYEPPPGRGKLLEGVKKTWILDDSYNASPIAMEAALQTLGQFPTAGKRIAILGDMLELGTHTIEAHKAVGRSAAKVCDTIITVGVRAKFIAEAAAEAGFDRKKIITFDDPIMAGGAVEHLLQTGDVVLVKGSQVIRLEKAVEEIMLHPERKKILLARQEPEWQNKKITSI